MKVGGTITNVKAKVRWSTQKVNMKANGPMTSAQVKARWLTKTVTCIQASGTKTHTAVKAK